ncbi:MAG: hypothetical protein JRI43_01255 [Deltaproteobacteria bacterium]|nr:hypothetical protein [Deltaproteobacteria bacterium]
MGEINNRKNKVATDFAKALKDFELYEKFYLTLSDNCIRYLRGRSREYKQILLDIQKIILPYIKENCPTCKIVCCRLYIPELSIYIAGTVGGFKVVDYLLSRCDIILPKPCFENAERNLCPFWKDGCILPIDCRSYLCIQYFCDAMKEKLDMALVNKYLEKAEAVIDDFSIKECMI